MKKLLPLLILLLLQVNTAYAQNKPSQNDTKRIKSIINISPIILDTSLIKGTQIYTFKLTNLLDEPLGVRVDVEDFSPYADETPTPNKVITSPIVGWSKLDNENLVINPKEKKEVTLKIDVPEKTKNGGYYEAIFFTPIYLRTDPTEPRNVVSRIGALFFGTLGPINYEDLARKVSIRDLKLDPVLNSSKGEIKFSVENDYFNHFSAKPFLTISPLFGQSQQIELTEKRVLPGKARIWDEEFKVKSPRHLFYKANLAVSVGQGHYVYKSTYFMVFPWKPISIILITLLLIAFVSLRRKQFQRAFKVLISGK